MAIRPIVILPDPVLRRKADPVAAVDDGVRSLMDDMLETMYDAPGIGLAAPQIGISSRVIVMDCSDDEESPQPLKMANPEIIWKSEEQAVLEEGCLSIPGHRGDVSRPQEIEVTYLDEAGGEQRLRTGGLLAVCIQHEIDHLDGVLFIDYLSRLKRDMIIRKMTKEARLEKGQ
ncbi:MAG: peptide deformylase [Candidatus Puniceispirillales bacterium]